MSALSNAARMLCLASTSGSCIERIMSGSQAQTVWDALGRGFVSPAAQHQQGRVFMKPLHSSFRAYAAQPAASADDVQGLVLHDSAVVRLKELQEAKHNPKLFLRLEVEGGGCSGFQYKFSIEDQTREDDLVYERGGARLVCDPVSLDLVKGSTVEFEDSLMRSAFTVSSNPQSEASCGCGTSFAAKLKL